MTRRELENPATNGSSFGPGKLNSGSSQGPQTLDLSIRIRLGEPPGRWQLPVTLDSQTIRGEREAMCGRQALNVAKACSRVVIVQPKQQKIADGCLVQVARYFRVHSNAIQCVAEQKKISSLHVIKWLDTEMMPSTKHLSLRCIPHRKQENPH